MYNDNISKIKLKNINFSYDNKINVLKNINLSIKNGENIFIFGHNGSGKTTLVKILSLLLKPNTGEIYFDNIIVNNKNIETFKNKIKIIFQNQNNQFICSSVAEEIAFELENKAVPYEKMYEIINYYSNEIKITDLLNRNPKNLSGGQKQKVITVGILIANPDIIIFDESFEMINDEGKKNFNNLIFKIKKKKPNLILIKTTHNLDEIFSYNDCHIIILFHGKIVFDGNKNDFIKNIDNLIKFNVEIPFLIKVNRAFKKANLIKAENYSIDSLINNLCK